MSCLPWFKFRSGAPEEWPAHQLCAALGKPEADVYLYRLWAYCARARPDGRFVGEGAGLAVERAVRWRGTRGRLVQALLTVGLLAADGDALIVSNWEEEQGAHVAKVERDRAKPDGRARGVSEEFVSTPPSSLATPAREDGGKSGEKREEKKLSQGRKAEETPSRVRQDEAPSQPPQRAQGGASSRDVPAQFPPVSREGGEPLPDGIHREFLAARGAEYSWKPGRDDPASRELLALAGTAGAAEVVRRWRHGLRARFKQRCDTLADLVRRWEANATPEDSGPPGTAATPVEARRRSSLEVGRGEEHQRTACATGCGSTSCQTVWQQALCARCVARLEAEVQRWTWESVAAWVSARRTADSEIQHVGAP